MLTAKVYEATAFNEGILRIVRYRQEKSPLASINAVLLSIEHVVLVKAFADGVVEHTGVMPLFEISNHLSMDVRERYAESYLRGLHEQDEEFLEWQRRRLKKLARKD